MLNQPYRQQRISLPAMIISLQVGVGMYYLFSLRKPAFDLLARLLNHALGQNYPVSLIHDTTLISVAECIILALAISALGLLVLQILIKPKQYLFMFLAGMSYLVMGMVWVFKDIALYPELLSSDLIIDSWFSIALSGMIWFYAASLLVANNTSRKL